MTRGWNSRETIAGASKRNGIRAGASKPRPRPTARAVAVSNLSGPPRRGLKRPQEAGIRAKMPREAGIRAKPQQEHRNATEFTRNHSGSIKTQRNSRETTAGASKPRPRPTARAVAVSNLSGPPRRGLKRPQEAGIREDATRGRNSRETTAGASKCNGIHAKPQREHQNATEFARNHSGSVETKAPSHRARRCGQPPKWPPQKRPEEVGIRAKLQREHRNATEFTRNHSGSIKTQRNSRETTARASKPRPRPTARAVTVSNLSCTPRRGLKRPREAGIRAKPHDARLEFARNHSGSIKTQRNPRETTAGASKPRPRPTARAVAVSNLSGPPRRGLKRPQEAGIRAKMPREAGIRAKPQQEHRNATEFARNHSGSMEMQRNSRETTAGASKRNGIRAKPQRERRNQGPVPPEFARNHSRSIKMQRNSRETTAGASKRNGIRAKPQRERRNQGPVPPRAPLRSAT